VKRENKSKPPPDDSELDKIKLLKDEFGRIRRGGEFSKTRLLELFAFDVDDRGESALVKMLEMVKWLRDIRRAPGGLTFLRLERAMSRGRLEKQYRAHVQNLVNALFVIIGRAIEGEAKAQYQLQAFNRIAFPSEYDVTEEMIERVANHLPKALNELQRGRELLLMMDRISDVVRPKTAGEFLSPDTIIVLKTNADPSDLKACGEEMVEKVMNHKWNPKTTLRSLAVSIYLDQLAREDENSIVDEAMLRKGIRTELSRQGKFRHGPCWLLNVSQSRTEWNPFQISLLPLTPTIRRRKVAPKSQA
jgi:hypothetical protein